MPSSASCPCSEAGNKPICFARGGNTEAIYARRDAYGDSPWPCGAVGVSARHADGAGQPGLARAGGARVPGLAREAPPVGPGAGGPACMIRCLCCPPRCNFEAIEVMMAFFMA